MKPLEVLTVVATTLGVVATVLNLVAFVREKDRSHLKAGVVVLLVLGLAVLAAFLPRLAPATTKAVAARLPAPAAAALQSWLAQAAAPQPVAAPALEETMQGSATVDIRRNFLGGIDAIVGDFRFVDLSGRGGKVTSWRIGIQEKEGEPLRTFERVLEEPVAVPAGGTASVQVELDPEIGDRWLARRDAEQPGRMEILWRGLDADGNPVDVTWADAVAQ